MQILILGAGIAGAACALALQRHGHRLTLVERQPSPDSMGGGVVLWPNASHVLDHLGLLGAVAARAGTPVAMRRLDRHGNLLSALDIGQLDAAMGQASHAILRRDLQAVLLGRLQELGVQVQYGQAVMSLSGDAQQQGRVHLADGRVLQADLILGAEGRMRSAASWLEMVAQVPAPATIMMAPAMYSRMEMTFGVLDMSPLSVSGFIPCRVNYVAPGIGHCALNGHEFCAEGPDFARTKGPLTPRREPFPDVPGCLRVPPGTPAPAACERSPRSRRSHRRPRRWT